MERNEFSTGTELALYRETCRQTFWAALWFYKEHVESPMRIITSCWRRLETGTTGYARPPRLSVSDFFADFDLTIRRTLRGGELEL
jgi:hypothetical protein